MANTKISDLAAVVTLGLTDSFPVVQSSTTKKAVVSDILDPTYSGNLKFADGYGIDFSASEGGGASSSVLDDYEEGTWTPVLSGSTSTSGQAYSEQTGTYTKIGRFIYCFFYCTLTTVGSISGNAQISGLPFTVRSGAFGGGTVSQFSDLASNINFIGIRPDGGGTTARLRVSTTEAAIIDNIASTSLWQNGSLFMGSIIYEV